MNQHQSFSCPDCYKSNTVKGPLSTLLICFHCGQIILNETGKSLEKQDIPEDWSCIQIGTTGEHKKKSFLVIGRIRLQLRQEYLNLWSLWYEKDQNYGWLIESLGQYAVYAPSFFTYTDKQKVLELDTIKIAADQSVKISFVDTCEGISFAGEITSWYNFTADFRISIGHSTTKIQAMFIGETMKPDASFLLGEGTSPQLLQLNQIRQWNEWPA